MAVRKYIVMRAVGLLLAVGVVSCNGPEEVSLRVVLRTDYQPLREFASVQVIVDAAPATRLAEIDGGYIRPGEPIATFEQLAPNENRRVTVRLLRLGGNLLLESSVRIQHLKNIIVTVAVTRDCTGVECEDSLAQRCLAGRCVDDTCISGDEISCPEVECEADKDCAVESPCSTPKCEAGVCFSDGGDDVCPPGKDCDVASGVCVEEPSACSEEGFCDPPGECGTVECITELCIYKPKADSETCSVGMCDGGVCVTPLCANGIKDPGESAIDCGGDCSGCPLGTECNVDSDCISGVCDTLGSGLCETANTCGNGRVEMMEGCDDGDVLAGDGCNANCLLELGEMCLTSMACASGACDITGTMTCVMMGGVCNDGVIDPGESCDDRNNDPGDGCSPTCLLENGEPCTLNGQCDSGVCDTLGSMTCEAADTCGNGNVEVGEGCDDGGTADGDGCTSACLIEIGGTCTLPNQCLGGLCVLGSCFDAQTTYEKASNSEPGDRYGWRVQIDGDTMAVSAIRETSCNNGVNPPENNNGCDWAGAVYVFRRTGDVWNQEAYLKAGASDAQDRFGWSLDLDGDTLAVGGWVEYGCGDGPGADEMNNGCQDAGAVWIFTRSGTTWSQEEYIKASNSDSFDRFGTSLALDNNTLVVGADGEASCTEANQSNNLCNESGAAYVFTRAGTTWTQQAYLKASTVQAGDWFGHSVTLDGDTLAVGAPHEDSCADGVGGDEADDLCPNSGAAYVFTRAGTVWTQRAYIKASNSDAGDELGYEWLALSGATLAMGAWNEDSCPAFPNTDESDNGCNNTGAVYVMTGSGASWTQQAFLKAINPDDTDRFGREMVLEGDKIAVGSLYEKSCIGGLVPDPADNNCASAGAVYLFTRVGTTWTHTRYIKGHVPRSGDAFSTGLDFDADWLAVGAYTEDACPLNGEGDEGCALSGASYLFDTAWY